MPLFKKCLYILPVIFFAMATTAAAKTEETQCVSIDILGFNLLPEKFVMGSECSVSSSKFVRSKVPDQIFLYELGVVSPEESCFVIVPPDYFATYDTVVDGIIVNPETGDKLDIKASGLAGLTANSYSNGGFGPLGELSFTAVSLLFIMDGYGRELGPLVTRDAGTILTDGNAAARLSVVKGQGIFSGATGYIDEVGQEFDLENPATASGRLCGKGLADSLFTLPLEVE